METDYASCEARILVHEGGYTDGIHPFDPGGCTNLGVTIADAKKFWKSSATCADVKVLPKSVASDIIHQRYWAALNCQALPAGVDDCILDYGYNSGNSRAGKVLRRLLSLPDTDWHVTDQVIAECNKRDPKALINAICDERMKFLEGLAIWPTYRRGWTTRVTEVRQFSTQLAAHDATPTSTPLPTPPPTPTDHTPKGTHPVPSPGPVITGGGALTLGSGGLFHWLGAHPSVTVAIIIVGAVAIGAVLAMLQKQWQAKQDAPTAGIQPVPVT